jgi:hypothetical protein
VPNTWHHIQIGTHHDSTGFITYDWVGFDGVFTNFIGAAGHAGGFLNWTMGDELINFQLDGNGASGTISLYANEIQVWYW